MRILIIDDSPEERNSLSVLLKTYGSISLAPNGKDGIEAFSKALVEGHPFSMVFLDMVMPDMDSRDTLLAIRNIEKERSLPPDRKARIILMRDFSSDLWLDKGFRECDARLFKPVSKKKLHDEMAMLGIMPVSSKDTPSYNDIPDEYLKYRDLIPAIKEHSGKFEFYVKHIDEQGTMRVLEAAPSNIEFFQNVIAGQIIARIEDHQTSLKTGEGVLADLPRRLIFAEKSGRVIWKDNTLSVEDIMVIDEDVKYKDINFLGFLEINGDVKGGANIYAMKGIKVKGIVDSSRLESRGDIEVERVNGRDDTRIVAGGNFRAKFVYNASVKTGGDINIEVEAVESILKAGGSITGGTVTGGEGIAAKDISLKRAGSPKDLSTLLKAGHDFHREDRINYLKETITEINKKIEHIDTMLGPGGAKKIPKKSKGNEKEDSIKILAADRKHLQDALLEFKNELEHLVGTEKLKEPAKISIEETLYKGVRLLIHELEELTFENIKGPFTLDEKLISL